VRFDTIGGMQTQIYRQVQGLDDRGVRQTVLCLRLPEVEPRWVLGEAATVQGVRVPVLPLRSRTRGMVDLNLSWALGVMHHLRRFRKDPVDVVHAHCSGVFWPLVVGWWAARRLKARLVLTIHCSLLATYEAMHLLDHAVKPVAQGIERAVVRRADHTVVLTPRVRELNLEHRYAPPEAISIVPDSIDVEAFRSHDSPEKREAFRRRHQLPTDRPIITYLGRIAREKGWPRLLELAHALASEPVHFLICGDGNERDLLEQRLRDEGLAERFTVTGYLPLEQVPSALAVTDVLVLPSNHEEFGGVLIEAMSMEVPSVAFAVGGVPQVMEDGVTGLLAPAGDLHAMAGHVRRLLADRDLARSLGQRGRREVSRRFSLDTVCDQLHDIYRRVAE
jgi:2-deoxystreptamine N-acetyl-D-glucosaminyltransferase/2-deoxystreptamine glucosyltransferase